MKRQAYESSPLPISLELKNYIQGKNDYIPFVEREGVKSGVSLKQLMSLIADENPAIMVPTQGGKAVATYPTKTFYLDIDSAKVASMPWVPQRDKNRISSRMSWTIGKNALYKNDFVVLNIISNLDWSRPVYFSTTLSTSSYLNLKPFLQLEGLAYRLMPIYNAGAADGVVNTPVMYQNMLKNMFWRNLDNPEVYYDENYKRFPLNARKSFYMLASQLINESKMEGNPMMQDMLPPVVPGKNRLELAKEVLDYCFKVMPDKATQYDVYTPQFIPLLQEAGNPKLADEIAEIMYKRAVEDLEFAVKERQSAASFDVQTNVYILQQLANSYRKSVDKAKSDKYKAAFERFYPLVQTAEDAVQYEDE
jgi:hypothetical protein